MSGWGSGAWGAGTWGDGTLGTGGALTVVAVSSYRENIFRIEFSGPVYWSGILDPQDSSRSTKWTITPVAGTTGLDDNPARALLVSEVRLAGVADGVVVGSVGRFVDVVCDRAMTPHPAMYDVGVVNVYARDLLSNVSAVSRTPAVFKQIAYPQITHANPSRDFANPMTLEAARDSLPDPTNPLVLGAIRVDDTGDYAFDEGLTNLRKRVLRRLFTVKGGFAHLPNYGVGMGSHGKRLAIPSLVADLAAAAEVQLSLEPDVGKAKVQPVFDPAHPGFVRFRIIVRPKTGAPQGFEVPFSTTD